MTESDFSNPSSSLPASGPGVPGGPGIPGGGGGGGLGGAGMLGKGLSLVRSAAQAGTSLVKTQLFRQDRTTETEYQHRMSICQSCPGGHATFHADGSLNTCGPMLKSMAGDGHGAKGGKEGGNEGGKEGAERKTCGCVLSGKARDRKQGCPFSYWPPLNSPLPTLPEKAPASPAAPGIPGVPGGPGVLPGVPAMAKAISGTSNGGVELYSPADQKRYEAAMAGGRSGHLGGGYLLDPSRRRFLGQSAAAMVGLMATRLAFSDTEKKQYIPIRACGSGSKKYVLCGNVQGKRVNDVFVDTQGDCYQLLTAKPQNLGNLGSDAAVPTNDWAPDSEEVKCDYCKYYEVKKCSDSSVVGYIKKKDFYAATNNKSTGKTTSGDCVILGIAQDPLPSGGTVVSLQANTGYDSCQGCGCACPSINVNISGVLGDAIHSDVFELDVECNSSFLFYGTSDDVGVLIGEMENVSASVSASEYKMIIPENAIIFQDTEGYIGDGSGRIPKLVGIGYYQWPSKNDVNHVVQAEAGGFQTRSWGTPVTSAELIARGWASNGIARVKFGWVGDSGNVRVSGVSCS